jgi:rare lipoprotein A
MANGERFDENALTVAFNKLPLGALVTVTNVSNEQAVTAKVTDRGGFESLGRIIDLSKGVKEVINCSDLCQVRVEEI